ncbi:MAG: hypothetical protein QG575_33 [Euryarchaeota archaeon]|nr:hypothetical protein [Euryarchaeota archaeon]
MRYKVDLCGANEIRAKDSGVKRRLRTRAASCGVLRLKICQKRSACFGQASMHLAHLMQSGLSSISFTGSCMGQTFWHLPQSMHFSLSTFSWYFLPPIALCSVPIGQKEHQVRGAMIIPKRMAIDVVRMHSVTKTIPILSTIPSVCIMRKTMNPMSATKIGARSHMLRNRGGIFSFRLMGASQKSTKLPLGQRFPQNQRPRNGAIIIRLANTSKRK